MSRKPLFFLMMLLSVSITSFAMAEEQVIGSIKTVEGTCLVIRKSQGFNAKVGLKLYEKDALKTGLHGGIGVILRDDTVLSIGPNSEIMLEKFAFSPVKGDLSMITKLMRGTLSYLSGQIGKLSPQAVRLETPTATIGVRGTYFLAKVSGE